MSALLRSAQSFAPGQDRRCWLLGCGRRHKHAIQRGRLGQEHCQKATGGPGCAARRSLRNCVEIVTVGRSAVLADVSTRLGVVDLVCLIVGRALACSQIAFCLHRALGRDRRS